MNSKGLLKLKNCFRDLGKKAFCHSFWFFLTLLFIDLAIGAVLLWQFVLSPENQEQSIAQNPLTINKALIDKFSQDWLDREKTFEESQRQSQADIFVGFRIAQSSQSATSTATSTQR